MKSVLSNPEDWILCYTVYKNLPLLFMVIYFVIYILLQHVGKLYECMHKDYGLVHILVIYLLLHFFIIARVNLNNQESQRLSTKTTVIRCAVCYYFWLL